MVLRDIIEQSHPKGGERLVIKIDQMIVRGELGKLFAHAGERRLKRQLVQIIERHRDVRVVGELRWRNGGRLKCIDQRCDLSVARKLSRLQFRRLTAGIHFLPNEKKKGGTNDRHDKTGRMKRGARLRFREHAPNQAADDRPGDAEKGGLPKTEMLPAGNQKFRNAANDCSDNDRPNDV